MRTWVRISAPDTGWTFFTFICDKNSNVCSKKTDNRPGWSILKPLIRAYV